MVDATLFEVDQILIEPDVAAEDLPFALSPWMLDATATTGIDLAMLDDDPQTNGEPRATVEALVPGVPGALTVGMGIAPGTSPVWTVLAAVPGAVDGGRLGVQGVVDTDFLQRAELRDLGGNRTGRRPRRSVVDDAGPMPAFVPPDVPVLAAPAPGGSSGGASYDLVFDDVLAGWPGQGLYRVRLATPARAWTLYRVAGDGGTIRVPDLAAGGGVPLPDGTISATLAAFAWDGFEPSLFLWSDVEREHDAFTVAAPVSFQQP
jgi:hypothetical protein